MDSRESNPGPPPFTIFNPITREEEDLELHKLKLEIEEREKEQLQRIEEFRNKWGEDPKGTVTEKPKNNHVLTRFIIKMLLIILSATVPVIAITLGINTFSFSVVGICSLIMFIAGIELRE